MTLDRPARALFRMALRAFPRDFRRLYGPEAERDFAEGLARRRGRGAGVLAAFAVRASWDAARQGWRERTRQGPLPGHGARAPGTGRGGDMFEGVMQDVRLGLRSLRRNPGLTAAAVAVLALGIGANTTVFSALKMAILSPPPYPDPDRLVVADLVREREGQGEKTPMAWSYPKFQVLMAREDRPIDPVAGYALRRVTLTGVGDAVRLPTELVSPGYFRLLGRAPEEGRAFGPEDGDAASPTRVAILSHRLWQERFGGDPSTLGRSIILNGSTFQVVGVAPPGFSGLTGGAQLWVPMATGAVLFSRFMVSGAQAHWFHVVGRLRPGTSFEAASAWMTSAGQAVAEAYPTTTPGTVFGAGLRRFVDVRSNASARAAVTLLAAAAALVLLVACANLSGLLLARAKSRARDGAVRLAVGASRWRLIRAGLVESTVLALAGGAVGVLVAVWGTRAMAAAWPERFLSGADGAMRAMDPRTLGLDPVVLAFALLVSLVTAVAFGLAPALRASRGEVVGHLKRGPGVAGWARRGGAPDLRGGLVGAQVALALMLLVGAGLVGGSLKRLLAVDEGFDAEHLLIFQYAIPRTDARWSHPQPFHQAFMDRVAALGGVEGVTVGTPPLSGHWSITGVEDVEGRPPIPEGEGGFIGVNLVGDDHFRALGIPILRGRALDASDGTDAHPTIVISQLAAQRLFPDEDPVGKRIRIGITEDGKDPWAEIVGVAGNVLYGGPDRESIPEAYFSYREFTDPNATVIVRTRGDDPMALLPSIRAEMKEMAPDLAIFGVTTMADQRASVTGDRRVVLALLALFAAVTVLLAATGTWGIVAYAVADRRRELGLRMALGSDAGRVVRMVVRRSLSSAAPGLALGLVGAWVTSRVLQVFLFRTSPRDPATFAGGAALLLVVVVVASWLPARRASRVDPAESLRAE